MIHQDLMRSAIAIAQSALKTDDVPVGALIVDSENNIISTGFNEREAHQDPTAHAEVVAIRNACKELGTFQLDGCEIYTSCEPCPMCLGAIYWARPDRMYFANTKKDAADIQFDDQFIYNELELHFTGRKMETRQMMREEALVAFKLWSESISKIEY